ncbi:hypothetical protein MHIB_23250 [Mycolicibacter hiberniae]|uniref:Uncharacterized protein n=1 Tax=Mycolicibacter hiberniae TaxID=29314 RepID=A0A7I7X4W3_9MYCO|nr:hypothetical protein AWC09_03660 [Mycolicibacter hiberniae]BBZ23907.1 hypothetical protein MHIB_23250 [Mycolicibacter hiberniae]
MSLLDRGGQYEPVTVYPEVLTEDIDGNPRTSPDPDGIPTTARFQVMNQTGTSARRSEEDNEGFESEEVYSMRFPRSFDRAHGLLGLQSQIDWHGDRWSVFGYGNRFNGSPRTARFVYTIKRS